MSRARAGAREALLAVSSASLVVVLLGVTEGALRALDPGFIARARSGVVERVNVYSEDYGWRPRPAARVVERGAQVSVNARGWRGVEVPHARGAAARLVLLGDSLAFGHGVADAQTFAALLARPEFEVVNLAVEGYGPDQALLRFEREGRAFEPDAVALSVCLDNDFADVGLGVFLYDGRYPKPYFTLERDALSLHDAHLRLGPWQRAGAWLRERSQLYGRLAALLPEPAAPAETWRARREGVERDVEAAAGLLARLALRLRDGTLDVAPQARPARLIILLHPSKESYRHGSALADVLAARLTGAGIDTLDLARLWRARGLRFADFAFDATGHLNAHGHELVAEELRAWWAAPHGRGRGPRS